MLSLSKNQTISLAKEAPGLTRVALGLGWSARKAAPKKGFFARLLASEEDSQGPDIDLDASCLMFSAGRLVDQVWFHQLRSEDNSVFHTGDDRHGGGNGDNETITVNLAKVGHSIDTLIFTVNSFQGDTFDQIERSHVHLIDGVSNKVLAEYNIAESGSHTGLIVCSLSWGGASAEWQFTTIGQLSHGRTFQTMLPDIYPFVN